LCKEKGFSRTILRLLGVSIGMNMKKLVARYKCKISTILCEKKGRKKEKWLNKMISNLREMVA
jgi:hypothetical protein